MISEESFWSIINQNRDKYATLLWDSNGREYFIPKKSLCSVDESTVRMHSLLDEALLLFVVDLNEIVGMETIK